MAKSNDDFTMSDDQVQAMKELEIREARDQEDSDWTEEKDLEFYNYLITDEPDHGVKERLARINAELNQEPEPKPEKERSVIFKEELVSLVIPPEDAQYEEDYVENDDENLYTSHVNNEDSEDSPRNGMNAAAFKNESPDEIIEEIGDKRNNSSTLNFDDSRKDNEEELVLERNGRFQIAGKDDYESSGRNFSDDEDDYEENHRNSHNRPTSSLGSNAPLVSRQGDNSSKRPVSAPAQSRSKKNQKNLEADLSRQYNGSDDGYYYRSPYALSVDTKKRMEERRKYLEQLKEKRLSEEREEERKRREENERAFQFWLNNKKERSLKERQMLKEQEEKEREEEEKLKQQKKEESLSFRAWSAKKRNCKRQEEKMNELQRAEFEATFVFHTRQECRAAFKEWLKRKNKESLEEQLREKQRARLTRLALRKSRKSQNLAHALMHSNQSRFADSYGSRF